MWCMRQQQHVVVRRPAGPGGRGSAGPAPGRRARAPPRPSSRPSSASATGPAGEVVARPGANPPASAGAMRCIGDAVHLREGRAQGLVAGRTIPSSARTSASRSSSPASRRRTGMWYAAPQAAELLHEPEPSLGERQRQPLVPGGPLDGRELRPVPHQAAGPRHLQELPALGQRQFGECRDGVHDWGTPVKRVCGARADPPAPGEAAGRGKTAMPRMDSARRRRSAWRNAEGHATVELAEEREQLRHLVRVHLGELGVHHFLGEVLEHRPGEQLGERRPSPPAPRRTRETTCVARSEWPPSSKKLSRRPTRSTRSTSAQISASACSVSSAGASYSRAARASPSGAGSALRSSLPLGVSGSALQRHERAPAPCTPAGSAAGGRAARPPPLHPPRTPPAACRPARPRAPRPRSLAHRRVPGQRRLDLPQLDAEAADLHLVVQAAQELQRPVRHPPHPVARAVQPRPGSRRTGRPRSAPPSARPAQVAARHPRAADVQLARHPDGHRPPRRVEHVQPQRRGSPARWGSPIRRRRPRRAQRPVGHVDGGLRGPVHVHQPRRLGAPALHPLAQERAPPPRRRRPPRAAPGRRPARRPRG